MKAHNSIVGKVRSFYQKNPKSKLFAGVFVLLFAVVGVALLLSSFAAVPANQVYITPATASVLNGDNVTVAVRINPPTSGVDSVQATISYDQTRLQFVSMDSAGSPGSPFTTQFAASGGNGTVNINRGIPATVPVVYVTADSLVANVTFRALVGGNVATMLQLVSPTQATFGGANTNPTTAGSTITLTSPVTPPSETASFTIESTNPTPPTGTQFGLKVFVTSNANMQGGQVNVNLPAGMAYQGTLDTAGTAFSPATTVTLDGSGNPCTSSQKVCLVFATQSANLTGKQLIATIPVIASNGGTQSITFTQPDLVNTSDVHITSITANPFSITVGTPIAKPIVSLTGGATLGTSVDIIDFKQSFTITNFDTAPTATYTVTIGSTAVPITSGGIFAIPISVLNGNYTLLVAVSKSGSSDSVSTQMRLRSPNVNRIGCVDLTDLLAVNKAYGSTTNIAYDLDFNGTVGLVDLLTITRAWGTACV